MFRIQILKRSKTLKTEKKLHLSFFESEDFDGACGLQHYKKGYLERDWVQIQTFYEQGFPPL
jgi:hypothetical protein